MNKQVIPILFASDSNYVKYLYVAILSMLIHKKNETIYDIHIMCTKLYDKNILNEFKKLQEKYQNIKINYIVVGNLFNNSSDKKRILPSPTYYYLKIADIFQQYDKALYLDPDIIVLEDLSDLFNTDLDDNYVAGVKAATYMDGTDDKYYKSIGLNDLSQYINANSLVFNLKLIRENNITDKFYKYSKNIYPSMDQDVLNIVCYGKIKHIPIKYNLMVKYLPFNNNKSWTYEFLKNIYGEFNLQDAENNPVIIHYANVKGKPWLTNTELDDYWWKYARMSPFYNSFLVKYNLNRTIFLLKKAIESCISITNKYDKDKNKTKVINIFGFKIFIKTKKNKT